MNINDLENVTLKLKLFSKNFNSYSVNHRLSKGQGNIFNDSEQCNAPTRR